MRRLSAAILAVGLSLGCGHAAFAAPPDDEASRLAAIERDNATLRKEIAALRERERLMTEKAGVQQRVERRSPAERPVYAAVNRAQPAGPIYASADRAPVYKAPYSPPAAYSWTGCYVGAGGGYGMWNQDNQTSLGGVAADQQHTDGGRGWFGTGQIGCDYQLVPKWLIGAFGDVDLGSIKGTITIPIGPDQGDEKETWSWAAGGRVGYLPWDSFLVYLGGGFTQAHFDSISLVFAPTGAPVATHIGDATYNGWFIGSGYEYKLDWLPGLFWKTEYRFADYGSRTNDLLVNGTNTPSGASVNSHTFIQTIRSELVYRFNFR